VPKFTLIDGDVSVLTRAFNALREGAGTVIELQATAEGFLEAWRKSPCAFASPGGFVAVNGTNLVLCQFEAGPVDAAFADDLKVLLPELLKAWELPVIRAATIGDKADRLLTMAGMKRDGVLRKLSADANNVLQDVAMWSLTREDLTTVEAIKEKPRSLKQRAVGE
jgi:hypothetical protein